jgi:hypothetical protein
LSIPSWVGCLGCFDIAVRKCLIQIACFAASATAIYSASVVDIAVIGCFRLHQLTGPLAIIKTYALVDLSFVAFPYAESEYPIRVLVSALPSLEKKNSE